MLRLFFNPRRFRRRHFPPPNRSPFSSSPSNNPGEPPTNHNHILKTTPQPPILPHNHNPLVNASPSSKITSSSPLIGLSAAVLSAVVASVALLPSNDRRSEQSDSNSNSLYGVVEHAVYKSNESFRRLFYHARQTGIAASVLWQSLSSVLSSANHEVRVGFELRVAALLADIAAANGARREALVGAGGGKVVDWLLETVAMGGDGNGTQAEAARALAYLIADPNVSAEVLGRPQAVPHLLRFIFSCQPKKKQSRRSSFDNSDSLKGRSMLVAAIMDIVTSNCDSSSENVIFKPFLPGNAEMRDINAAIEVIEEGGLHMDRPQDSEDDDSGGKGIKGIGIKILEGTPVLGLARSSGLEKVEPSSSGPSERSGQTPKTLSLLKKKDNFQAGNSSFTVVPGLWDDLHCQHVAVPFAAWALANWAMASETNRLHIQELDQDGQAVMTALMAPERSVKWHGSLVARLLLEDRNLPLSDSVSDWSSSLITTVSQASKNDDIPLAQMALSAFLLSVERSQSAREIAMGKALELMRDTAKQTEKYKQVQEAIARALELISTGDLHLSIEESQKWAGILLPWVFGKVPSDNIRASSKKILSCILEDHGPSSVPISQGWLTFLLNEVLVSSKAASSKGNAQQERDKVKTQIDQSNILLGTQTISQLAGAVVNLAWNQFGASADEFPLEDLLSMEPFTGPFQSLKKEGKSKFNVADSASATLKGIKAITELCSENPEGQDKIAELGALCLLRRFLLSDDYERLSAREAYDASRELEAQGRVNDVTSEVPKTNGNDLSSLRVPPTAHIRRHAARLLTVLSHLPKVQKAILADKTWCKWLEDCADGKILGCNDLKIQSYARATLLNVFCCNRSRRDSSNNNNGGSGSEYRVEHCPRYDDMMFLISPDLPHWKRCENTGGETTEISNLPLSDDDSENGDTSSMLSSSNENECSGSGSDSHNNSELASPKLDVVFVHGLRGGPYKSWRLSENKVSTKSGLVEKIDEEAGKLGTFWPAEWLSNDLPQVRMFSIKYKTNLTQWSGATLPLQEVSSKLLEKLVTAGIGNRPVVFVTHSMGGLVVKQMLHKAKAENIDKLVNNTVGIVFYSCPHFGSKLADMPWRMGLVLRPAPTIGELRSGSPRLVELNDFIRQLHKKRLIEVLSFCETKVTPIVEGYGGWALRMEIVPIESAYPGFGDIVVLESTDHINSCKPINKSDPSYTETLEFLRKLKSRYSTQDASL